MKLGIAVASKEALPSAFVVFRDSLEVNFRKAHELGYDGVELALLDASQVDPAQAESLMKTYGLEIPMISSGQVFAQGGLCFTSPDRGIRNQALACIKELVDVASGFGAMVNIGRVRGPAETGKAYPDSEKRFLDCLDEAAGYARPKGVEIAIEPVNRYELNFVNRVEEASDLLKKLGRPNLRIMPDLFHMNIEEASLEAVLTAHIEEIAYIHFADSNRLAPGMGHLNFPKLIRVLEALGYTGYITAEILPYPTPDKAAEQAARYLRALLPGAGEKKSNPT
jgi:sugar phosphate isomerase/epimerase